MEKKKTTAIDNGFLVLYDWLPALQTLEGEDVKALLLALIDRQRNGTPIPPLGGMTDVFARMIEPTIKRRLDGAKAAAGRQKSDAEASPEEVCEASCDAPVEEPFEGTSEAPIEAAVENAPDPCVGEIPEVSKEKQSISVSKEEVIRALTGAEPKRSREAERKTPAGMPKGAEATRFPIHTEDTVPAFSTDSVTAPLFAPPPTQKSTSLSPSALSEGGLSEREWEALIDGGIPREYIEKRLSRAVSFAASRGSDVSAVLLDWWAGDRHKYRPRSDHRASPAVPELTVKSFEIDDFFESAIERGLNWDGR
ncbi:MAG: hypothetical protein IJX80_04845 [Clostridia bacterium]|nr:hypothetical protein [Clostridia bacterium]